MAEEDLIEGELTRSVVGAFFEVYNTMGYGFLEHIYVQAMERELTARGHAVAREVSVPVFYKNEPLGSQRLDIVVDRVLIVEVKSTQVLPPAALRQLYSYLHGTGLTFGLLLHFGPVAKFYRQILTKPRRPNLQSDVPSEEKGDIGT
ncbi:MAG TPA: GxxExxY protein [Gemmatimonadaceae bacterium]|nr:GxxExxY protein [Gemmatimonadaceae bacterium]